MVKEREIDQVFLKKKIKECNGMETTTEDEELLHFFAELGEQLYRKGLFSKVLEEREEIIAPVLEKTKFTYVAGDLGSCASLATVCATLFITPADEKTHGFNRVDDSPQIF